MEPITTLPTTPTTLEQVKALPHVYARTHAQGYLEAVNKLPVEAGPITSKKIFMDKASNKLVYEFYRTRDKDNKLYVIF